MKILNKFKHTKYIYRNLDPFKKKHLSSLEIDLLEHLWQKLGGKSN